MPPAPLDEPRVARLHLVVAFACVLAGVALLLREGVGALSLQRAFAPFAMGGATVLIVGTTRLLLSGMAGRRIAGPRALAYAILAATPLAAIGTLVPAIALGCGVAWAAAVLAHATILVLTIRRAPERPPVAPLADEPKVRALLRPLVAGAIAYAALSAWLLPASYAGRAPRAAAVHSLLVGFVATTIMAVALQILPRFTGRGVPRLLLAPLAALGALGPGLVLFGLARGAPTWTRAGALVEGAAALLFTIAVARMIARRTRARPSFVGYAAGVVAILTAGALAYAYLWGYGAGDRVSAHGALNLLGFVGLFMLAASLDLYAPAFAAGRAPAIAHAWTVLGLAIAGAALASVGAYLGADPLTKLGLVAYGAAAIVHLVATILTHRRAGKVLTRFAVRPRA